MVRTTPWLRGNQAVFSSSLPSIFLLLDAYRIWLQRNALTAGWLERIEVVAEAREIARAVVEHELNDEGDARPEQLFTSAMTVQYASPVVAEIWRRCNSAVSN
jgi:hypothetical protein